MAEEEPRFRPQMVPPELRARFETIKANESGAEIANTKPAKVSMLFKKLDNGAAKSKKTWKEHLPQELRKELNVLITQTHAHRKAYKKTIGVKNAQLWIAVANLSKRLKNIEEQLERANL